MNCPNCEADLPDNAQACPWCGTEFSAPDIPEAAPQPIQPPVQNAPPSASQPDNPALKPVNQPAYQASSPATGKSKNWILWGAIVVVVILVLCCVCWFGTGFLSVLGGGGAVG